MTIGVIVLGYTNHFKGYQTQKTKTPLGEWLGSPSLETIFRFIPGLVSPKSSWRHRKQQPLMDTNAFVVEIPMFLRNIHFSYTSLCEKKQPSFLAFISACLCCFNRRFATKSPSLLPRSPCFALQLSSMLCTEEAQSKSRRDKPGTWRITTK